MPGAESLPTAGVKTVNNSPDQWKMRSIYKRVCQARLPCVEIFMLGSGQDHQRLRVVYHL